MSKFSIFNFFFRKIIATTIFRTRLDITREVPRNWQHSPVPLPPKYDRLGSSEEQISHSMYGEDAGDLPEHLRRVWTSALELSDDRDGIE